MGGGRRLRLTIGFLALMVVRLSPLAAFVGLTAALLTTTAEGRPIRTDLSELQFHAYLHLAGILVITADAVIGAVVLVRMLRAGHELAEQVQAMKRPASPRLRACSYAVGLDESAVTEVADPACYAFTHRLLRPRVVVSAGLTDRLTDEQLTAVLAHEAVHVRETDPLRVAAVACFSRGLLSSSAIPSLLWARLRRREVLADRAAVKVAGRRALARALLAAVRHPAGWSTTAATTHLGGGDCLEDRIAHLETGELAALRLTPWHLWRSMPAVGIFLALLLTCGH